MPASYTGLRVLLIARLDEEHGHNTLKRRALERLGCQVQTLDPDQRGLIERLTRSDLPSRMAKALEQHRPDLVVVLRGEALTPDLVGEMRRRSSARWVNWFPDDVRGLTLMRNLSGPYHRVFVSGTDLTALLAREGGPIVSYLPHGCDPSVHKPLRARGAYRANVVFAGAATPRREQLLSELVEFGLAVWGEGWRKTGLKDYCRGEVPTVDDYVRAYAGASVAINIHHVLDNDRSQDSRACNARLFEIAAIGVPQVVDVRGDLQLQFEENSQVLIYETAAELKGLVKRILQEDAWRERLASNARKRALQEHTYMHRLAALLGTAMKKP